MTEAADMRGQPTPDKPVLPPDKPSSPASESSQEHKLAQALAFPWHREKIIIAILVALSLFAVGVAVWRWNVNEDHLAKIQLSKPKKSPYVDGSIDRDEHATSDRTTPYERTASESTLQIPVSIFDMKRLPLSGNGCVIILLSINGAPTLIHPLFEEDAVLAAWDYKGSFQFPIMATDHCSLSGEWPRINFTTPSSVPPVPAGAAPAALTPQQKALSFLAMWSLPRFALGKERQSLTQFRAGVPMPQDEANKLFNMLVPISETAFGVKLRYSAGDAEVAGIWFPTSGTEHIALIGRPDDFQKAFGGNETIQIPIQVRRTSDAKAEGLTSVVTIATRVIVRDIQDTTVISSSEKIKTWLEALLVLFQPDADGPFSQAWRLGPDGCEFKKRDPQNKGFVRVYTKDKAWQYMPVMERCP